jgi:hypothetical protein
LPPHCPLVDCHFEVVWEWEYQQCRVAKNLLSNQLGFHRHIPIWIPWKNVSLLLVPVSGQVAEWTMWRNMPVWLVSVQSSKVKAQFFPIDRMRFGRLNFIFSADSLIASSSGSHVPVPKGWVYTKSYHFWSVSHRSRYQFTWLVFSNEPAIHPMPLPQWLLVVMESVNSCVN